MKYLYKVMLLALVTFSLACSKNEDPVVTIEEAKPKVTFTYALAEANDAFTMEFKSTISDAKSIRWEFGDDSVSTEASPKHTYLAPGQYRVLLTATNGQGYKAQREAVIKILADEVLNFTSSQVAGGLKLNVASSTTFTNFKWLFADNTTSTEVSPVTTIPSGSIVNITLIAQTSKGSSVTINRLVSNFGVAKDVTFGATLTVSRDNDSGPASGEGSLKLVDNNPASKWLYFDFTPESAQQVLTEPRVVKFYSLTSGDDSPGRDPKAWTLEGSVDGTNWELLDMRTNQSFLTRTQTKLFAIENSKAFAYYKWTILENNGDGLFQVAEWRLYMVN